MGKILLRDLSIQGVIGISDKERSNTQEILVNIELWGNFSKAFQSDSIYDCINYRTVAKKIQAYVRQIGRHTVEALANDLITLCLEEDGVLKASVTVEKPGAVRNAKSVGVQLVRDRTDMNRVHQAYLLLGSNINPNANMLKALEMLNEKVKINLVSSIWQSKPFNGEGGDFLNAAVWISTRLSKDELEDQVVTAIEKALGRVRTDDKNAPRTMDVDLLVFDESIINESEFDKSFVLVPMNDIRPDLKIHKEQDSVESYLEANSPAGFVLRKDILFQPTMNRPI